MSGRTSNYFVSFFIEFKICHDIRRTRSLIPIIFAIVALRSFTQSNLSRAFCSLAVSPVKLSVIDNCVGVSLEGSVGKGVIVEKYVIVIEFEMRSEAILLRLFKNKNGKIVDKFEIKRYTNLE